MIIDQEFKDLIPPMKPEEYEGLEASILEDGCRDALILWGDILVDGHNRLEICTKHHIIYKTAQHDFESRAHARIWIRKQPGSRRNLSDAWKISLALGNKEDLAEIGKAKLSTAGTKGNDIRWKKESPLSLSDKPDTPVEPPHNTQKQIADFLDMSTGKVAQAEYVIKHAPALWTKAKDEDLPIGQVYKKAKHQERMAEVRGPVILPFGIYNVIYADPPWKYDSGEQHTTEGQDTVLGTHYPSMTIQELCDLPIKTIVDDNAALFMWVTSPLLYDCLPIIKAWGFQYKASMVWDKIKHNVGHYVSVRHEFLLICTRGSMPHIERLVDSVYEEERTTHSKKPEYFRTVIEIMYPDAKRIELFAREEHDNWEVWGNEV